MKKKILLLSVLFMCSRSLMAQINIADTSENSRILRADSMENKRYLLRQKRMEKYKNVSSLLKVSLLFPLSGCVSLHYEQKLNKAVSLTVGGGISLKNHSFSYQHFDITSVEMITPNQTPLNPLDTDLYDGSDEKTKPGYTVSAEGKYYFNKKGMQGVFLGAGYQRLRFNTEHYRIDNNAAFGAVGPVYSTETVNQKEDTDKFFLTLGGQVLYKKLVLEYSCSMAYRQSAATRYAFRPATYNQAVPAQRYKEGYLHIERKDLTAGAELRLGYHF